MKALEKLHKVLAKEVCDAFVIAEVGQAHDGSLGQAMSFIAACAARGADAVKFQTHYSAEESSSNDKFRVNVFPQDATRQEYWRRMEFTPAQWELLAAHAAKHNVVFLSSPFSQKAVSVLDDLDCAAWKIASGELRNLPMLEMIMETGKPILISTGMSSWAEIDAVHDFTTGRPRVLFQCTTEYPSKPQSLGLNNISIFRERYGDCVIGLSDHSGEVYPSIAAYSLGARVFEVHVTWSKEMFGPDTSASLDFVQFAALTKALSDLATAEANPVDKDQLRKEKAELVSLFGRGVYARENVEAGQTITLDKMIFLKPISNVLAWDYKALLGKKAKIDISAGTPMQWEHFE